MTTHTAPPSDLRAILTAGESAHVEFKEQVSGLDREMVGFANGVGGSIFLGVSDQGQVKGLTIDNALRSRIQDIARNCDPPVRIKLVPDHRGVLEIRVPEGLDKPYQCRDGFFLREGANTQKLRRDEIIALIKAYGKVRFDDLTHETFRFPEDFDAERLVTFLRLAELRQDHAAADMLANLGVAREENGRLRCNQTAVLFFAKHPQRFLPEAALTCVRYRGVDRFEIIDKQDIAGTLIEQIEQATQFVTRHVAVGYHIDQHARRKEVSEYPVVVLREAITNAVMHRDYLADHTRIYLSIYADRLEVENPGGLPQGILLADLGRRSVRRNPLIADLLSRAKYVERVGSGITRMRTALADNGNPPFELQVSNYFSIRFYPRPETPQGTSLTPRQSQLYEFVERHGAISKRDAARLLNVSEDTGLRALREMIDRGYLIRTGQGKSSRYRLPS